MKRFIMMLVCAVALCGCTRFSNADIECYEVEAFNHDYLVFENPQKSKQVNNQ